MKKIGICREESDSSGRRIEYRHERYLGGGQNTHDMRKGR